MISDSLNTVVKGSGFVLIGSLISSFILLAVHIIIARVWGKTDLGIFTLAFSFLQLFSTIGALGVTRGVTRNLAYYIGKKDQKIIPDIIFSSIFVTIIASSIIATILFLSSNYIAENIFKEPSFALPLKIFSFVIPINNIINIFVSVFRGFKEIKPLVYFQQIMQNVLFFLFLMSIVFTSSSFIYIFYLYLASLAITCTLLAIYSFKKMKGFKILNNVRIEFSQTKPLLLFSLPLLAVAILNTSTSWVNNLMIGGIRTASEVGLYKAAGVITGFVSFPIGILLVLYMPVVSNLYGLNKIKEIKRIYIVLTKWLCFLTFPMFLFLFLFSTQVIKIIYGNEYILASNVLRILLIGAIITNFAGPNGSTLVSIGKPRFVMYSILVATVLNIILNIILIPKYGIIGAALSVGIAILSFNIIKSSILYYKTKVISLSYNLLKPTIFTIAISLFIYIIVRNVIVIDLFILILFFILFYMLYSLFFLITKSIDPEDINIIGIIGEKIHLKTNFLTKFLSKFIK